MPTYHPITLDRHAAQRWQRYSSYAFAAADTVAPLTAAELPKATLSLPIAFLAVEEGFKLFALQGVTTGKNLYVAPDGRWLAGYVPAIYRGHPFRLANTDAGQQVLCIDEDSGLLGPTGEAFFDDGGTPAQGVRDILEFLTQVERNRAPTIRACAALQKHNLIQPWPLKVQTEQGEQAVEGLYRIDEAAMNQLPADALLELRDAGALVMAYCQLLSMQHLPMLGKLAAAHESADQKAAIPADLNLEFLNSSGTISFGNLI